MKANSYPKGHKGKFSLIRFPITEGEIQMKDVNYEKILEKIARVSGLDKEEIQKKLKLKRAKLSDLISYEGATQIVAAELGINFENEKLKINELLPGMRKVNVIGKMIKLSSVKII